MQILEPKLKLRLLGQGIGLPPTAPVDNFALLKSNPETSGKPDAFLEAMARKIEAGYGQGRRRLIRSPGRPASANELSSEDLAVIATREAIRGKVPSAFILGSTTSRRYTGSQAAATLGKLGMTAPAFEVRSGCSTSQAALLHAYALLKLGYPDVVVSCAETLSKVIHPEVKETWFGFGDGAGSLWLAADDKDPHFEVERVAFNTEGEFVDLYTVPGRLPPEQRELDANRYYISGDGQEMRDLSLDRYVRTIEAIIPAGERKWLNWIVPHQVNLGLVNEAFQRTGLGAIPLVWDATENGNLGGTSIVFSLAKAFAEKRFKKGDRILLISVGGGLSYGAQLWKILKGP